MNGFEERAVKKVIETPPFCNLLHIFSAIRLCFKIFVIICYLQHIFSNAVSQTDCYVSLSLPTASPETVRTKTVKNCKDPVWNETFCFRIQSQVKVRYRVYLIFFWGRNVIVCSICKGKIKINMCEGLQGYG